MRHYSDQDTRPEGEGGTVLLHGVREAVRTSDGKMWVEVNGTWNRIWSTGVRETFALQVQPMTACELSRFDH